MFDTIANDLVMSGDNTMNEKWINTFLSFDPMKGDLTVRPEMSRQVERV